MHAHAHAPPHSLPTGALRKILPHSLGRAWSHAHARARHCLPFAAPRATPHASRLAQSAILHIERGVQGLAARAMREGHVLPPRRRLARQPPCLGLHGADAGLGRRQHAHGGLRHAARAVARRARTRQQREREARQRGAGQATLRTCSISVMSAMSRVICSMFCAPAAAAQSQRNMRSRARARSGAPGAHG